MIRKKIIIVVIAVLAALGCSGKQKCRVFGKAFPGQCKSDKDQGNVASSMSPEVVEPVTYTPPVAPTTDITEVVPGAGQALTRITPEQMSRNLIATTNFGKEFQYYDRDIGQTIDLIQALFGVPLGGIDFLTTKRRDPSVKAQTLLVSRVIAWQYATYSIATELNLAPDKRVVFADCDMEKDRPFQTDDAKLSSATQADIRAGEVKWSAQIDTLFWRAYARPPTTDEKSAVKTAFSAAYLAEGNLNLAWVAVFYAILSSQEYWYQ